MKAANHKPSSNLGEPPPFRVGRRLVNKAISSLTITISRC